MTQPLSATSPQTSQIGLFVSGLSFVSLGLLSPEDKRKIVQISDTSAKFHILDPLQVGNDLR